MSATDDRRVQPDVEHGPPSARSSGALDALNVFLADVRDGLGPYLAIDLTARHWAPDRVGWAMTAMGVAAVVFQTPAGAWIDRTRHKRLALAAAALAVAAGTVAMVGAPSFAVILAAQGVIGAASAVFGPAVAALSLGLVGHARFARRTGRNEAFNHAGNVAAALLAGVLGNLIAYEAIFYQVAAMSLATIACVALIRKSEINDDLARGAVEVPGEEARVVGVLDLFRDRRVAAFSASIVLFHFANAAMLPLVGQKLTAGKTEGVAGDMSACIIAAQLVMVPVALASSRMAETWGRRPTFLIGFAVLPVRGLLYTLSTNPVYLVGVQLLDGVGAGIFGVVGVMVIADLTRGTGRFNLMQGALAAATGLGAALSNLMTGYVVKAHGFDAGFFALSAAALAALAFFALLVPETRPEPAPLAATSA